MTLPESISIRMRNHALHPITVAQTVSLSFRLRRNLSIRRRQEVSAAVQLPIILMMTILMAASLKSSTGNSHCESKNREGNCFRGFCFFLHFVLVCVVANRRNYICCQETDPFVMILQPIASSRFLISSRLRFCSFAILARSSYSYFIRVTP